MPFMIPAAAGASAIGTAALGGAAIGAGALGTGIAAGAALAGGAALPGLLGGMGALGGAGTAGSVLGGTALTPAVASLAPAATAQAMGPTLLQASLPGMQGGMGALAPGVTSGATSGLAGAANPALASQYAAAQQQAALAKQNLLAQSGGTDVMGAATQRVAAPSPYDLSTGLRTGVDPRFAGQQSLQTATGPTVDPTAVVGRPISPNQNFMQNLGSLMQNPSMQGLKDYAAEHPYATSAAVGLGTKGLMSAMQQKRPPTPENNAMIRPYEFDYGATGAVYQPGGSTSEQLYFNPTYTAGEPYKADEKAEGGIASAYAVGGPVEQMSAMNSVGANTGYPMANINTPLYANPMMQRPEATNVIAPSADAGVGAYSGEPRFARGGEANLGDYSDGGRLLKGPGDGVSDSIPASIGNRQPARLADGEFVVPARIVSELGNGSTEAGARKLYAMMDRVQKSRKKSVGKGKVAVDSKASKHLPA
jgi:hypothetical protein